MFLQKNLFFLIFPLLLLFPLSINFSLWTHFYSFEIYLLFGFLAILLYILIFRLNSHIKINVWLFTLMYLIGGGILLLSELNLTQNVSGIQTLQPSIFLKLLFCVITFLSVYSVKNMYLENIRSVDFLFYIIFIFIGSCGLFSFNDFIMIFLSLEILSLSSYILVAYDRKSIAASESGIKYLVLGGISTIFFLLGVALIYFYLGSIDLNVYSKALLVLENTSDNSLTTVLLVANLFLITSLLFKLGAAPFHFWLADIYEGAPANVGFFLAIVPKLSIFLLLVKFFSIFGMDYNYLVLIIYFSLLLGSFLALSQRKTKRFIAYSSVSHMGFALLPVVAGVDNFVNYTLIYFIHYTLISFLIWLFILVFFNAQKKQVRNLIELSSLFFLRPILAFCFAFVILSLAGIPPFLGFWAKFWAIFTITQTHAYFLVLIVLVTSFIAIQYYIKLLKLVFYEDTNLVFFSKVSKASFNTLSFLMLVLLLFSLMPFSYMEFVNIFTWLNGFYSSNMYVDDYQHILISYNLVDSYNMSLHFIENTKMFGKVYEEGFTKAGLLQGLSTTQIETYLGSSTIKQASNEWSFRIIFEYFNFHDFTQINEKRLKCFEYIINISDTMVLLPNTNDDTILDFLKYRRYDINELSLFVKTYYESLNLYLNIYKNTCNLLNINFLNLKLNNLLILINLFYNL